MEFRRAEWIWADHDAVVNEYGEFIETFELSCDTDAQQVRIGISAETNYELLCNGQFVGSGQYHDYRERKVYDEYDLAKYCVRGRNKIAIVCYRQHTDCSYYYDKGLGLLFEVQLDGTTVAASGAHTLGRRSRAYASGEADIMTGQMGYAFEYDADKEDDWRESDGTMDGFCPCVVLGVVTTLAPRPIERTQLTAGGARICAQGVYRLDAPYETLAEKLSSAYLSHRTVAQLSGLTYAPSLPVQKGFSISCEQTPYLVIDLGEAAAGYFTLDVEMATACRVHVSIGEHLEDLRPRAYIGGRCFAFTVGLKAGRTTYTNYMRRLGARYLALHFETNALTLYDANLLRADYPLNIFDNPLQDGLRRRIYDVCVHTLKICMHEHYEDTPWREQSLYAMDSRMQMLCGYYAFGEHRFAAASLRLLSESMRTDGLLSLCAPMSKQTDRLTIMSFSLVYFVQLAEYLEHSSDTVTAKELFETVEPILTLFLNRVEVNGLVPNFCSRSHWNFYEWTDGMEGNFDCIPEKRYECPLNAFLSLALNASAKLCAAFGAEDRAARYGTAQHTLNDAIRRHFYRADRGVYASFLSCTGELTHEAELTQSLVLCCGAAGDTATTVLDNLMRCDHGMVRCSLSHSIFKYDALIDSKRAECIAYAVKDVDAVWGSMVFSGATSCYETADGAAAFSHAGSLSHGWSAVPIYVYQKLLRRYGMTL